jgi:hypothetical protein
MALPKSLRDRLFDLVRRDLALFLADHEEHLLVIFREEIQRLDDEIPEENLFIDIQMVPLGEAILKSALHAITRFLTEDFDTSSVEGPSSPLAAIDPPDVSDAV